MAEKRRISSPNVPIPVEEVEKQLGLDKEYTPTPDDAPTAPDLRAPCPKCFDYRKVAIKTPAGTRFETCPDCRPSEPPPPPEVA